MKKQTILVLIFLFNLVLLFSCSSTSKSKISTSNKMENSENVIKVNGKIIKQNFTNKIGKENPEIWDLYLVYNDTIFFIKHSENSVKREELVNFIDKNIECTVEKSFGLWDTDDPEVQSRVGNYVIIYEIKNK
jgi:hypothetical protein